MNISAEELRLHDARSQKSGFLAVALGAFAFATVNCNGLTANPDTTEPIWPTNGWQNSTPEEQGMDSKELAELVDFGARHSLDSLLVLRHGKIVAEAYYAPYFAGLPHTINSCTKSIISTLTAIALKEGSLKSPSARVIDFFDRSQIANLDTRKEAVTVQNLLDMTSGFGWEEPAYGKAPSVIEMVNSPDWVKFILDRLMSDMPGTRFQYDSGNAHLLSAILTKVTGISAAEYAKAKLFAPLGIKEVRWGHDPQGISLGPFGLFLQPRDMAKIGYLYLRNGVWENKQVVPPTWIDQIVHATIDMHSEPGDRYSNFFWSIPAKHVYMALGAYRQMIMVFPELDIVAVTTGRADDFASGEFADLVFSSVKSNESLPADASGANLLAMKIRDTSTEKRSEVGPVPELATSVSGKVYSFSANQMNLRSLSLVLTDPKPRYDIEMYDRGKTNSWSGFSGPIGLDGLYRKTDVVYHGFDPRYDGAPRVNAVKGTWRDEHTFVINCLALGDGHQPEQWTLTFDGKALDLRVQIADGPEFSANGQVMQDTKESVWPTKGWQTSTPEEQGMDATQLAGLVDFGTTHSFDSLLIARHGKIVTEAYYAPYTTGIPHAVSGEIYIEGQAGG